MFKRKSIATPSSIKEVKETNRSHSSIKETDTHKPSVLTEVSESDYTSNKGLFEDSLYEGMVKKDGVITPKAGLL